MSAAPVRRALLGSPWPLLVRVAVGAVAGFAVVEIDGPAKGPGWQSMGAAVALALVAIAAPEVGRWAGRGVPTGVALATGFGLYAGVPETDHVVGVIAVLAVTFVAELTNRMRPDWLIIVLLGTVLVWAAVRGASGREPPLLAGLGLLGYLIVAPLVRAVPGPSGALLPRRYAAAAVVILQVAFAFGVARLAAIREETVPAVVVTGLALAVLVVSIRVVAGPRP